MNTRRITTNGMFAALAAVAVSLIALSVAPVARADPDDRYQQHNLISDGAVPADNTDANLINPWGIVFNPFGPVWISDNGAGVSTLYNGAGVAQSVGGSPPVKAIIIPPKTGETMGNPTGIVFNGSSGFVVTEGTASGPAKFIWVTEDGVLAGWNPTVDLAHAIKVADNSLTTGAVYKGLALSAGGTGAMLYATDFHNNKIDVWDSNFSAVTLPAGAFTDPKIPSGFAPFGIQAINGNIYVTYAMQDGPKHDDVKGQGHGFVNVFDPNGNLLDRVATRGALNSPWGLALAPAGFGMFSNTLLVGNFGDGQINAYDLASGNRRGHLRGADGRTLMIDGLWGIAFGNGFQGQPVNTLFFTAGPNEEANGLYGRLDAMPDEDHDGHGRNH